MAALPKIVPLRLNLGCSDTHMKDWVNVDLRPPCDQIADLSKRWPWGDSTVEAIQAHDIFEHLPDKIHTMNEAHRVLTFGGRLDIFVPTTDGRGAFQDPTHRSFWTPNDVFYYCEVYPEWRRFHEAYGITARFRIVELWHAEFPAQVWKLRVVLEAVKAS